MAAERRFILNGRNTMGYWDEEVHPAELPISAREAWHRDAWEREQIEMSGILQQGRTDTDHQVNTATYGTTDSWS